MAKYDTNPCRPSRSVTEKEDDYFAWMIRAKKYDPLIMIYLVLIDIFRGNIYAKIYNYDIALKCYKRAIKQFDDSTSSLFDPKNYDASRVYLDIFLCKTIVKTQIERGRLYFEMGKFVRALKHYLKALANITLLSLEGSSNEKWHQSMILCAKIDLAVKYLEYDEKQSVHNKPLIRRYFEKESDIIKYFKKCDVAGLKFKEISNEKSNYKECRKGINPIRASDVKELIKEEYKHIVAELFSLIAKDLKKNKRSLKGIFI